MTDVRFYHMERQSLEQVLPALLAKALENGHRILIKTANEAEAERLAEYLWTYRPEVFMPHGTKKDGHDSEQPIYLTAGNDNPNGADVLILTNGTTADDISNFKLCCEMLDGRDPEQVGNARERWKSYKDSGHALTYWQQGEKSWEKKNSA
jgi:DNA polymerase-3 subunit chi